MHKTLINLIGLQGSSY